MSPPTHRRPVDSKVRSVALAAFGAIGVLAIVLVMVTSGSGISTSATPIGAAPASTTSTTGRSAAVTFAFGGDMHFEGRIGEVLRTDPAAILAGVRPILAGADVAMANLETAVTGRGSPPADKEYAFRAPARAFAALSSGGLDVVTMANNHGLDYGPVGLDDSLAAARAARFPVVGIGTNAAEAFAPWKTTVKGQRIAVFGVTHVIDSSLRRSWTATDAHAGVASAYETERLVSAIVRERREADTIVVYVHWGTEGHTCPNDTQPALARSLVEAGADIVVGGHSHRVQGAGRMGNAFVAYGLGNFVFYKDRGPGTESGVLTLTATGRRIDDATWHPARLVGQLPQLLTGGRAATARKAWDGLRGCAGLA